MRVRQHPKPIPEGSRLYTCLDSAPWVDDDLGPLHLRVPWTPGAVTRAIEFTKAFGRRMPTMFDLMEGAEHRDIVGDLILHAWAHETHELEAEGGGAVIDEIAEAAGPLAVLLIAGRVCADATTVGYVDSINRGEADELARPPQPRA